MLLVFSEVLYVALLRLNAVNGVRPVVTFLGIMSILFVLYAAAGLVAGRLRERRRAGLLVIALGAVLFRLTLIPAGLRYGAPGESTLTCLAEDLRGQSVTYERFLLYDDDVWRYLWDGHVAANGVNPYLFPPASSALDQLAEPGRPPSGVARPIWSDVRDNVSYSHTSTVYPPLAQAVFLAAHWLAPGSVAAMKGLVVAFDLLAAFFLAFTLNALGRPAIAVVLYLWNPLVIKVFAGSGHVDSVLIACLAATAYFLVRRRRRLAAASFALSVLAKLSPIILLPFVARRVSRRDLLLASGVLVTGYLPFAGAGHKLFDGLLAFAHGWQFNAGPMKFLEWVSVPLLADPGMAARAVCGLAALTWAAWLAWRDDGKDASFPLAAVAALGGLLILSPTVMPWYVTWLLPFAVLARRFEWLAFSAIVCLAFLVMINGTEYAAALWLEYSALAALLLVGNRRRAAQSQAASAGGSALPRPAAAGR